MSRSASGENGSLFAEERQQAIMDRLRAHGKVTVEELSARFRVSAPTVRADLGRLEELGLLRRTHGGAISSSTTLFEPPYAQRQVIRYDEKRVIARAAASLIKEGETILLDAGTTTHEIAMQIKERKSLTVVTNSVVNALELMDNSGIEVILIGGSVQPLRRATLGPLAVRFLQVFHVDRAFMAFNGIHPTSGYTVVDFDAAEIKQKMMDCADDVVVVSDSGKIGQIAFASVAPIQSGRLLITDTGISKEDNDSLSELGLEIMVCS